MLRYFFIGFFLITASILSLAGFRGTKSQNPPIEIFDDMDRQPRYDAQHPNGFFADDRAARKWVDGTLPLGFTLPGRYLQTGAKNGTLKPEGFTNQPDYYDTGKFGDTYGDGIPLEISGALMARGQQRYDINCAVCHGLTGAGNGIVGQYGVAAIANLLDERIRVMPDGQIYSTIRNGKNTMGAYGPQIAVEDRWAIVAYMRALQKSQHMTLAELPEEKQKEFQSKQ